MITLALGESVLAWLWVGLEEYPTVYDGYLIAGNSSVSLLEVCYDYPPL